MQRDIHRDIPVLRGTEIYAERYTERYTSTERNRDICREINIEMAHIPGMMSCKLFTQLPSPSNQPVNKVSTNSINPSP